MARLDILLTGTQITDEYLYRTGSTAAALLHDTFLASTIVVRTAAGGGGTLLTLTTDYTLSATDTRLTTDAGATVQTKIAIVNGTYQNTALYVSYKTVGDYARSSDINNRGRKIGLEAYYVSSDLIRVRAGSLEVNDVMVVKTAATDFTTGATNFPGAGAWVFFCMDTAGTITLETATGNGTVRPSDACFQLTGSSVGYDDLGKFGYYLNPRKRIFGAAHRVSATSWYFIDLQNGQDEVGMNSRGAWIKTGRKIHIDTLMTSTAGSASTWTYPISFTSRVVPGGASLGGSGNALILAFATPSTSACGYSVFVTTTGSTAGATAVSLWADGE
jgi:hypothetical protein